MNSPILPYSPLVDDFGNRLLKTQSGEIITFEEAFLHPIYLQEALQLNPTNIPIEFTMFVLRKMAVNEKDVRNFEAAIPSEARAYLQKLIGPYKISSRQVHPSCDVNYAPSTFRGLFTKIFCKKVISNSQNVQDTHFDKLATLFPFQVSRDVPEYEIRVLELLDDEFYEEIQKFLNEHFDNVDGRSICKIFLTNIHHFMETKFPAESLVLKLESIRNGAIDCSIPLRRLNAEGIKWYRFLYREFDNVQKCFRFVVPASFDIGKYDDEYFRCLPERNFSELYGFLEWTDYFQNYRQIYTLRFKKYLFFFVHALQVDRNPVFFIDNVLFECLKSLRRYKTVKEDINMVIDLAKITLLQLRLNPEYRGESFRRYHANTRTLYNIKKYLTEFIIPRNPRLDVRYKTDLMTWMPFRTDDICFNVCYSKSSGVKNLLGRILSSVLCPEDEPIKYIVSYNAFKGVEECFVLPTDVESIRNFILLCNTRDVTDESLEQLTDDFLDIIRPLTETYDDGVGC